MQDSGVAAGPNLAGRPWTLDISDLATDLKAEGFESSERAASPQARVLSQAREAIL